MNTEPILKWVVILVLIAAVSVAVYNGKGFKFKASGTPIGNIDIGVGN